MASTYRCLTGIDYDGKRAEAGDVVADLPADAIGWLTDAGHIEPAQDAPEPEPEPAPRRKRKAASDDDGGES